MKKVISAGLCVLCTGLLFGCAPVALSPQAKLVKIAKSDPPDSCEDLGPVNGNGFGDNAEAQVNRIRTRTAEKGGNYFRLDTINLAGFKEGTAFKCP